MIKFFSSLLYPLLILILPSCSQMNTEAQDYYYQNKKMQHGLETASSETEPAHRWTDPIDANSAKRGKKIYTTYCLECHGPQGDGKGAKTMTQTVPTNLKEVSRRSPQFRFYMKLAQVSENMLGWKNALNEKQITDLSHYLRQLAQE